MRGGWKQQTNWIRFGPGNCAVAGPIFQTARRSGLVEDGLTCFQGGDQDQSATYIRLCIWLSPRAAATGSPLPPGCAGSGRWRVWMFGKQVGGHWNKKCISEPCWHASWIMDQILGEAMRYTESSPMIPDWSSNGKFPRTKQRLSCSWHCKRDFWPSLQLTPGAR